MQVNQLCVSVIDTPIRKNIQFLNNTHEKEQNSWINIAEKTEERNEVCYIATTILWLSRKNLVQLINGVIY